MGRRTSNLERVVGEGAEAARVVAGTTGAQRTTALMEMAEALERRTEEILRENQEDMAEAKRAGLDARALDVLLLDGDRVTAMAERMRRVSALPDPIGRTEWARRLPNGMSVGHERVPVGLVAVVYEAAPHVTTDAAAMCIRAGNAAVLRGGAAARRTNRIVNEVLEGGLREADFPAATLATIGPDAAELDRLLALDAYVDLLVTRGDPAEVERVAVAAAMPVLRAPHGVAHVYVDAGADPDVAAGIVMSLATQRPREQTLTEVVLVHEAVASAFGPSAVEALAAHGVPARMVASLEDAAAVVESEGTGQLACVIAAEGARAERFAGAVSTGCVLVNASPRIVEGEGLGEGAALGVAASPGGHGGPVTLGALTTTRLVGRGQGQVP